MKLEVDRARCDGFGLCAEAAPDLVQHDGEGYPVVVVLSEDERKRAEVAVDACPVAAMQILEP